MKWWEWLLPWRWPMFRKRKAAQEEVQSRFQAALAEAKSRHNDVEDAVDKLKKTREQRKAKSMVPQPRVPLESHR